MEKSKRRLLEEIKEFLRDKKLSNTKETVLFVTVCSQNKRGDVWSTSGPDFERTWQKLLRYLDRYRPLPRWLKIDIKTGSERIPASEGIRRFARVKRNNYFQFGVSFKKDGSCCFLPEEISGNALLTPVKEHKVGENPARLQLNAINIRGYLKRRYQRIIPNPLAYFDDTWEFFETAGVFIEAGHWLPLETDFFGRGMRQITKENQLEQLAVAIQRGTDYLFEQIHSEGSFCYGYYPAYDKQLPGYNSVRHFSSLYALLEATEYLASDTAAELDLEQLTKIESALDWGLEHLCVEKEGHLFIAERVKQEVELKLGAQAIAILALAKYEAVTGYDFYHPILLNLLEGLQVFIDEQGRTTHVLTESLQVKEKFRIVYYDGEALFALMRAYPLTKDSRWLKLGELLMDRYVREGYERYHDHWLSYSVNELTRYVPKQEYFRFGVKNALENLTFMENRDTAYPTFLELLCAADRMFDRIQETEGQDGLFSKAEYHQLQKVQEKRALHEMRTGIMWPEYAMYFAKPETIAYGFYARHDRMRMRIDDAEHFLSGLINYSLLRRKAAVKEAGGSLVTEVKTGEPAGTLQPVTSISSVTAPVTGLKKADFQQFNGVFFDEGHMSLKEITDFEYFPADVKQINLQRAFLDLSDERIEKITGKAVKWQHREQFIRQNHEKFGLLVTERPIESLRDKLPQFIVPDVWEFMHEVAAFLRSKFTGPVIGITGSVGKSSVRLMLEQLLKPEYRILSNRGNHNTRLAIPLYLLKLAQNPEIALLEISLNALNSRDRGPQSLLVEPTIAILTSVDFAHVRGVQDLQVIAQIKSRIFAGLVSGGTAIINGDIDSTLLESILFEAGKTTGQLLTYSMSGKSDADLYLVQRKTLKELTEVTVAYRGIRYTYQLSLASDGMIENSMAAFLTLCSLGLDPQRYMERLQTFKSLPKVMEKHSGRLAGKQVTIIDDTHNAAIPSMINGIRAFAQQTVYYSGRKILVLGQVADLGEHTEKLHEELVPIIDTSGADLLLAYGSAMEAVVAKTRIPADWFSDMDSYVTRVLEEVTDHSLLLLKGSVSGSDYHKISERLLKRLVTEPVVARV